jgi:hypothetical protein
MTAELWIALAGLIVSILAGFGGIVWTIANMQTSILQRISAERSDLESRISGLSLSAVEIENRTANRFGEGLSAIREKINQVELFVRDTYLPIKTYERDQDQKWETIKAMIGVIEKKMEIIEVKIDRLSSAT